MDVLNTIATIFTVAAFGLAAWQYAEARRKATTERERIALQRERLRAAITAAAAGADTADFIVQRGKQPDATTEELLNLTRVMRAHLKLLAQQLEQEERTLGDWQFGRLIASSASPPQEPPRLEDR